MKKTVHVVPHSHWDREWYFTTSRSKIYLMNNLKRVISLLQGRYKIGRAVQQECRDRSRMPSSA
ncbi:Mannosylglycerate hydrolase [Streptococcus pasteurianus]|nr:Mannosylglycerate hydrolase [Streptococcus pasteurianus]